MIKLTPFIYMILLMFSCDESNNTKQTVDSKSYKDKTIMAIFAHGNDEITVSPILSKYAKEGVNIYLVIVSDGSKQINKHGIKTKIPPGVSFSQVRSEEILHATKTLEINPPILLNYTNLITKKNVNTLGSKIDSLFNKYQPNLILTMGPEGAYGDPEHCIVNSVVTGVFQNEKSRKIQQLLYVGFLKEPLGMVTELNTELVKYFKNNLKTTQKKYLTYRISVEEEDFIVAREALACHKSQFTPEQLDEIFLVFGQTEGLIYLRPWNGSEAVKDDIFD